MTTIITSSSRVPKKLLRRPRRCLGTVVAVLVIASFGVYVWSQQGSSLDTNYLIATTNVHDDPNESSPLLSLSITRKNNLQLSCKYHGNCPANTVCDDGVCQSFLSHSETKQPHLPGDRRQPRFDKCVQSCLLELSMDEYYYYGMLPTILQSYSTRDNQHDGCVIQFKRERASERPKDVGPFEAWIDQRFRRVVRVDLDPSSSAAAATTTLPTKGENRPLLWNALCDHPCEDDSDCAEGTICLGRPEQSIAAPVRIHLDPKTCQRPSAATEKHPKDMVIVTGANTNYYSALRNFAASLKYWAPERKLVIYNLGMSDLQLKDIPKWSNVLDLHWKEGIPKSLPPHVQKLHNYAWKSIIINETVHQYQSIFWLDAGATLTGPIDAIEEIIHRNGIFLVRGQDEDMKRLSHPGTYEAFGYHKDTFRDGLVSPHFAGGIQGHVYPSRFIDSIVIPNAQCAIDPNCIAPAGSTLGNHRYDQTSLSILAYQSHVQAPHYTEYLAAGREQLHVDMKKPSEKIIWTARGSCQFYSNQIKLRTE